MPEERERRTHKIKIKDLREFYDIPEDYSLMDVKTELNNKSIKIITGIYFTDNNTKTLKITKEEIREYLRSFSLLGDEWKLMMIGLK